MTGAPAVSVLLTAYNHAPYVEQALDSVAAQTCRDLELIVTDDHSSDGTAEVIRGWLERTGFPAVFLANERNVGIPAVRNRALAVARGTFACSLAADDFYEPDRLERQLTLFAGLPDEVGFVYGDLRVVDAAGAELHPSFLAQLLPGRTPPEGRIFEELLHSNFVPAPGVMIRRSALEAVGPYDESLSREDYDMWLRLADRFEVRHLPGVVASYRVLPTSMSNAPGRRAEQHLYNLQVLLKWLGRSAAADRAIAERVRAEAVPAAQADAAYARSALRRVSRIGSSPRHEAVAALLGLPGAAGVLALGRRVHGAVTR